MDFLASVLVFPGYDCGVGQDFGQGERLGDVSKNIHYDSLRERRTIGQRGASLTWEIAPLLVEVVITSSGAA